MPCRKRKADERVKVFNLGRYWGVLAAELPGLYVIYRLASSTCASEAGCERVLFGEALAHSQLRNSMEVENVERILKIRWNWDKVRRLAALAGVLREKAFNDEECMSDDVQSD